MATMEGQVCVEANHCLCVLRTLNDFRMDKLLCDLVLIVRGKEIHAHRNVLAACSPYFQAMFCNNMRESVESKPIIFTNINPDVMEEAIKFMYTGEILITSSNAKELVNISNYFLITRLKDACVSFMMKTLNPSNCLGIQATADKFSCEALKSTATAFMHRHFVEVSQTEEFKQLDCERFSKLIESCDTKVDKEEQIFEAVVRWVKHETEQRTDNFESLIKLVRLPLMSPYYLTDHVESEELVKNTPSCEQLISEARLYHMLPDRRHLIKSPRTKPRKSMGVIDIILAVGGIQGSAVMKNVFCYLPRLDRWYQLMNMNTARCRHGLAVTGDMVYAVGGQSREGSAQSSLRTVERFDPKTNTWATVSSMLTRRSLLNVAVLDGLLYAVGGCDENNFRLNSVERYDPITDTWSYVTAMTTCRSSPCVVAHKYLYVIGGVSYTGMSLNTAEKFDPMTNIWTPIRPMAARRASACGALSSGKVYVIGGWDGTNHLNTGEIYDPDFDEWTVTKQASTARWDAGIAVDYNKIYIVGGCDRNALCTLETECYDTEEDHWEKVASFPVATHGIKCCSVQLSNKFI